MIALPHRTQTLSGLCCETDTATGAPCLHLVLNGDGSVL